MKRTRQQRIADAERSFLTAWQIANSRGWELIKHSPHHYTLRDQNGGILNLWPSSLKYARDQKIRLCEKFTMSGEWTLMDVVKQIPHPKLPPTTEPVRGPQQAGSEDYEQIDLSMTLKPMAAPDWVTLVMCFCFGFAVAMTICRCFCRCF